MSRFEKWVLGLLALIAFMVVFGPAVRVVAKDFSVGFERGMQK